MPKTWQGYLLSAEADSSTQGLGTKAQQLLRKRYVGIHGSNKVIGALEIQQVHRYACTGSHIHVYATTAAAMLPGVLLGQALTPGTDCLQLKPSTSCIVSAVIAPAAPSSQGMCCLQESVGLRMHLLLGSGSIVQWHPIEVHVLKLLVDLSATPPQS